MKFKKRGFTWFIKIGMEWYELCACINCGEVHASVSNIDYLLILDTKHKCCDRPNNWTSIDAVKNMIQKFVDEWSD